MVVDDLFALEQLGEVRVSPDGEWLAVVIARPRTAAETYRDFPFEGDVDHSDIWLLSRRGGERRNITNGMASGSGYWNPVWSPDGRRLAMLSTEGGDRVRPYVWERASDALRRVSQRAADLQSHGDGGYPGYAMIWTGPTTILCPVLPAGSAQTYYGMTNIMTNARSHDKAIEEWAKAEDGVEPSVSVLKSGPETGGSELPKGQLLEIDVVSGQSRVLAEGNFRQLLLSPTRRHLALIAETGRIPPQARRRVASDDRQWEGWRTRLGILALYERGATAMWIDSVPDPKLTLIENASFHSWSPDGLSFAAVGKRTKNDEAANTLYLVSIAPGTARRMSGPQLDVSATAWSSAGDLLALARRSRGANEKSQSRCDWWAIGRQVSGEAKNLTLDLQAAPPMLLRTPNGHTMLGVSAGDLIAINVRAGTARTLTDAQAPRMQNILWPTLARRRTRPVEQFVVQTQDKRLFDIQWIGAAARLRPLPRPSPNATIAEFAPERGLVVFTTVESTGTFLWVDDGTGKQLTRRLALNEHVREIADAERLLIDYAGIDGDSLKALLVLPVGYQRGKRYPLVTWVYGGFVVSDTSHYLVDKQSASSLNLTLLPARGYALLIPSMPLPPPGRPSNPYLDLSRGAMRAVERAITAGIADPSKLGIFGHSYGGYNTYAMVTYTQRFEAAIALAGFSNIASLYGTFWAADRYSEAPHQRLFAAGLAEAGQTRMNDSPWGDPWRYLRNSPLYYVDRVQTPVMIIQGDMDYVPIQQGEEFFTALYRLGKEAEFVRYWGEGHIISSPANVRDMWRRIFEWFDEHLKVDKRQEDVRGAPYVSPRPARPASPGVPGRTAAPSGRRP